MFENSYANLPEEFYKKISPETSPNPQLIIYNDKLDESIGLNLKEQQELYLSGNKEIKGSSPIALAYSGHQFGHFNPHLGDGRACLLGEHISPNSTRYDIQLKGSGKTPFSRQGDGKCPLGPAIREYLISEAMHALNIPTTRSLAIVATGETVFREDQLPGAILTRVAKGHIRIGTFEYFASRSDFKNLKVLTDYTINRFHQDLEKDTQQKYFRFFKRVAQSQLELVARWMSIGFIHGVMNTDNTSISGETIDYGPCAFMDSYNPNQVYSYIDQQGRYRYNNQFPIIAWNLNILANCLFHIPGINQNQFEKELKNYFDSITEKFNQFYYPFFGAKIGITEDNSTTRKLIDQFLKEIHQEKLDFTNSFLNLRKMKIMISDQWIKQWEKLSPNFELMDHTNPKIIPRNHIVEQVIIDALNNDLKLFHRLLSAVQTPFIEQVEFCTPPTISQRVKNTFCGT